MKNNSGSKTYSLYSQQGRLISTIQNGAITDYIYLGDQLVAWHSNNQPNDNQPGYTGHLEDDDFQLTYMQQRYSDPVIGRFYSNDPVGFSASNPMMFNRYAYGNNNSYKYIDSAGRESEFYFFAWWRRRHAKCWSGCWSHKNNASYVTDLEGYAGLTTVGAGFLSGTSIAGEGYVGFGVAAGPRAPLHASGNIIRTWVLPISVKNENQEQ
ncbi:hypothetical protein CWE13_07965 [Aliidiomarina shirensis]|uniref:RHS repeat-associated core domain-containing protein n=1 Tax=Aliidiomarina shirensis TaxID=1048642 RepID=A0A432WSP1_9GAMM|nr:RHS repeat-associated core domain-containing protein [Aliidiomarina shirensis]RUO36777.1 hypothetical protein CWE13_07965 [Aliidiomarina shirensis]